MLQRNECVTALSIKLGVISDLITSVILATIVSSYDKVSANTASSDFQDLSILGDFYALYHFVPLTTFIIY